MLQPAESGQLSGVIYQHSCEQMTEIRDDAVTLTVTSPPYWNAIDYDIHAETGATRDYRTRGYSIGYSKYRDYLDWCARIWSEVFRVTRPGGFCAVVIGTVLFEGQHFGVPFDFAARLQEVGWRFHQDIVWHKCTAGVKRAGSIIQKPYPGYFYPNIMTEYILVFRKEGDPIYRKVDKETQECSRIHIDRVFVSDTANNIWHIAPVPPGTIDHPCPFPEEIPYRLISLYSHRNDLVLDPFAGSGQTLKVARHLDRRWVGYETLARYVALSHRRIEQPLRIRPNQLIAEFARIPVGEPVRGPGPHAHSRDTATVQLRLPPDPAEPELSKRARTKRARRR